MLKNISVFSKIYITYLSVAGETCKKLPAQHTLFTKYSVIQTNAISLNKQKISNIHMQFMAKQSEAIVLWKTGGRQNVVLLCTLKCTCLAKWVHNIMLMLDTFETNKKESPNSSRLTHLHLSSVLTYLWAVVPFLQNFLNSLAFPNIKIVVIPYSCTG